jgi:cytochrome c biogenesis protein CcdA
VKTALVVTVASIAAADALNPAPTVACAYVLSTPSPVKRSVAFLFAAFWTRFALGAVVLVAFGSQIDRVVEAMKSGALRTTLQFAVGCLMIAGAGYMLRAPRPTSARRPTAPESSSAARAALFGVTVTSVEVLTAVPYIAGLGTLARAEQSLVVDLALIALFNAIYHAPPLALLVAWRRFGDRSIAVIDTARSRIARLLGDRRLAFVLAASGFAVITWTALS